MRLSFPANVLHFAVVSSDLHLSEDAETILKRTYPGATVTVVKSERPVDVQAFNAVLLDKSVANQWSPIAPQGHAKLILISPSGARGLSALGLGQDGQLSKPLRQKEVREMLFRVLDLDERMKLARQWLNPKAVIQFCEGQGSRTILMTAQGALMHGRPLGEVCHRLAPYGFVRINKSIGVNRDFIDQHATVDERLKVIFKNGKSHMVSRVYRADVEAG